MRMRVREKNEFLADNNNFLLRLLSSLTLHVTCLNYPRNFFKIAGWLTQNKSFIQTNPELLFQDVGSRCISSKHNISKSLEEKMI